MLHVFVLFLAPGANPDTLFSEELLHDTQGQVMTSDEARAMGFRGIPDGTDEKQVRLIAVAARDSLRVQRAIDATPAITSYKMQEVD